MDAPQAHATSAPAWRHVHRAVTTHRNFATLPGPVAGRLSTRKEWAAQCELTAEGGREPSSVFEPTAPFSAAGSGGDLDLQASIEEILERLESRLGETLESLSSTAGLLIAINGLQFGKIYWITSNITTIGRRPGSDIFLLDNSVSREHAKINRSGSRFTLYDLGSLNGVICEDMRRKNFVLKSFDELIMGRLRFLFVQGGGSVEGFRSPRYNLARQHLVRDINADTVEINHPASSGDDAGRG